MESGKESMASTTAAIAAVDQPKTAQPAVANSLLLQRVEALIGKADVILKSDALKAKGYIEKYWPMVAGALIAATRLLH